MTELPCPENDDLVIAAAPAVFDELRTVVEHDGQRRRRGATDEADRHSYQMASSASVATPSATRATATTASQRPQVDRIGRDQLG